MRITFEINEKKLQESVRREFGDEVMPIDIHRMQGQVFNFDQPPAFSKVIYRLAALCWALVVRPDVLPKKENIQ